MTAIADKLLDGFKKLAPDEQLIVRERVVSLTEARQREAVQRLRGSSAGKRLLDKLLADRARERARG
ncbi:MAG: hypothetical protein ACLQU4_20800 [Limisphaerales bacterium]